MTYEEILERMLARVSDSYDKREGSIIYDALAPTALELSTVHFDADNMQNEHYGDTASRPYLIRLSTDRRIRPYEATAAICTCIFDGADVPIGTRFTGGDTTYICTAENKVTCEEVGTIGNEYIGAIIPIDYVEGLTSATITEIAVYGEEEEDTEDLRTRYNESLDEKAFSGNRKDYIDKTLAIPGVGGVKLQRAWNGAGTILLTITNSIHRMASDTLITLVVAEFGEDGDGLAPIGHFPTVTTVEEVTCDVVSTITFDNGYDWNSCQTAIEEAIENYIASLRVSWMYQEKIVVRIAQIDSAILSVQGVIDVASTTLNGGTENITLGTSEIPVLGVVSND